MANEYDASTRKNAPLTPAADKKGVEILLCSPDWFDAKKTYKIAHAPARTAGLEFSGSDLNFMARVLYAEASGSEQLKDKAERDKEKAAIMNVNHFRLNRRGYPRNDYIATTFQMVCEAPGQFESVYAASDKFNNSTAARAENLGKRECADFEEAIEAIKTFLATGPTPEYQFDNFRGYMPNGRGTHIGRSRFWLSPTGQALLAKTP
jgi:spore germination cell wall hydrolase CwlJ-like protein